MRVIAGTSRGRRLAAFKGRDVRPTPDRVREALFSILQSRLGDFSELRVLDLFSGSGALAIEALSRGAESACLVENSPASGKVIRENLERCRLSDKADVTVGDAFQILLDFPAESFDLIFLDPPYGRKLAERAITEISRRGLLHTNGTLCAETGADEILPEKIGGLQIFDQRRYGSVMIHFLCDEGLI
jgi:16S rRNA (guanine(966)-N(2))-methyltransferase RsmD